MRRLACAAPPRAGATRVVLVDGRSGAGKTRLAAELAAGLEAPVVELEFLYPGWDGLEAGVTLLVDEVLAPLAAGERVLVPRWDWRRRRYVEPWELPPSPLVVIEGVGAGARASAAYGSLLVWVDAASEVRRKRALARDGTLYVGQWERWAAQEEAHLARERTPERADLVVDTTEAEPVVVRRRTATCARRRT